MKKKNYKAQVFVPKKKMQEYNKKSLDNIDIAITEKIAKPIGIDNQGTKMHVAIARMAARGHMCALRQVMRVSRFFKKF